MRPEVKALADKLEHLCHFNEVWPLVTVIRDVDADKLNDAIRTLEILSKLGNGDEPGNSHANLIARAALDRLRST